MCALLASIGSWGRLSNAVCDAWMVEPLGSFTVMPFAVGSLFVHGLLIRRKYPVQPESAKAVALAEPWGE